MTLGEIIKQYRKSRDISLRKFSELSGVSHSYIDSLEKNFDHSTKKSIAPGIETIKKVASAVGMTLEEIIACLDDEQLIGINFQENKVNNTEKLEVYKDGQFKVEIEIPKGENPTPEQIQEAMDQLYEIKKGLKKE